MDVFSQDKRSQIMSRVGGKNTKPELAVRSLLHRMGHRFRLHNKKLPGKPDITLPKHRKVILVHGCFWHSHKNCPRAKRPSTNRRFWREKLNKNAERDRATIRELKKLGWSVMRVWTCEIRDTGKLRLRLLSFLEA